MSRPTVVAAAVAMLIATAAAGCAQAPPTQTEKFIHSDEYVELYRETVASFPEEMPSGVTFPEDPPPMSGEIGIGNAAGMAYFFWTCAWEDAYLSTSDKTVRDTAIAELRRFESTSWATAHYEDPSGIWDQMLDTAELGDLSTLRLGYEGDCVYYRSVRGK